MTKDVHGARDVRLTPSTDGVVKVGLMDVCNGEEAMQAFKVLKLAERPDLMPEEQGSRKLDYEGPRRSGFPPWISPAVTGKWRWTQ